MPATVIGTDGKIRDIFDSGGLGQPRQLDQYIAAIGTLSVGTL